VGGREAKASEVSKTTNDPDFVLQERKSEVDRLNGIIKDKTTPAEEVKIAKSQLNEHKEALEQGEKVTKTPYEEFGVKIDKASLTTPEAVRAAKASGTQQIEEIARAKYTNEISKINDTTERSKAIKQLDTDVRKAKRSLDKMQTPGVSRAARETLRKAEDAPKIGHVEGSLLENMSPEEVSQKAAGGVTDDEEQMMEMIDLGREAEKAGGMVEKVYQKIYNETGGDPRTSLPKLRALMDAVRKAKPK
jgi:hypothetical protein